jgi:hypothetical protein
MSAADLDLLFGRGRRQMATGPQVEVFREAAPGAERGRYSKRFLVTAAADFRPWTQRECKILERLAARGAAPVAKVAGFVAADGPRAPELWTHDAGPAWTTGRDRRRCAPMLSPCSMSSQDCAHWWALARHCLLALDALHEQQVVHLDLKADNVCIPWAAADAGAGPGAGVVVHSTGSPSSTSPSLWRPRSR